MNIEALKKERARLLARCEAALNTAEAEGRGLTATERHQYDTDAARIGEINASLNTPEFSAPGERVTDDGQPGDTRHLSQPFTPGEPSPRITAPMPTARLKAFPNTVQGREAAHRSGRWFAATLARHPSSLAWAQQHGLRVDVMAALSGSGSAGALVPDELSGRIIELMDTYGAFRANADNLPMGSDSLTVPRRVGGLTAYYVGENTAGTESDTSWDNITLSAKKLMCLTRMSSEVAEDAIINLGDKLTQEIALAFAYKEDTVGFNGDGTSTYGGIVGVLVKALDASHTKAKVAAASTHDTFAEIDADDLLALMAAVPTYAKAGAKWYCSPTGLALVFNAIMMAGGGNSMQNLANAVQPTFLGYPIVVTPVMADDAAATYNGAAMIAFGNLAMAATVATRRDIRVSLSDQRYFELDQIGVKGTMRHDIVAHDLGSTTVKSPFCVLVGTT